MGGKENNNRNARQCTTNKCDSSRYIDPNRVSFYAY